MRLPESDFNNMLAFNKLPDWLRSKVKIMREIKRDGRRDNRIESKCTYRRLMIVRRVGGGITGNSFCDRPGTFRELLNRIGVS